MTAKVSKKNSFSTLSYQVLWLGSGIRPPRTIPLGPGFCIGHSYFCNLSSEDCSNEILSNIIEYDIIPMLKEYWFDNEDKFNKQAEKLRNALS